MALLTPMSPRQADQVRDLRTRSDDVARLVEARRGYTGGMSWKEVKGHTYLTRFWTEGGRKQFRYEGKRSPATEKAFAAFVRKRDAVDAELKAAQAGLNEASRVAKALRLGRVPVGAADVLRAVVREELRAVSFDDTCLAAYESESGFVLPTFTADRGALVLLVRDHEADDVARVVAEAGRKHDLAAGPTERSFTSPGGLSVTLLDRRGIERLVLGHALDDEQHDAVAWALDTDPLPAMAVGRDGGPVPLNAMDPRAHVLCLLGRSTTAGQRRPTPDVAARIEAVTALVADHGFGEPFRSRHAGAFEALEDVADPGWAHRC